MHFRKLLTVAILVAVGTIILRAQQSSAVPANDEIRIGTRPYVPQHGTIRVQSELVEVGVVVRDSNGKVVGGFKKEDFQVLDNGKPQKVSYFDEEMPPKVESPKPPEVVKPGETPPAPPAPPAPRYVAIFFDDVNSPLSDLVSARDAARSYFGKGLEPGEKVGLFTASSFFTLDFTADTAALEAALPKILPHIRRADDGPGSCPKIAPFQAWAIVNHGQDSPEFQLALAEAIYCGCTLANDSSSSCPAQAANLVRVQAQRTLDISNRISDGVFEKVFGTLRSLSTKQGKRVLLMASSGFFAQELREQREQVVSAALHAKIVINTLDAKGLYVLPFGGDAADGPPLVMGGRLDLMVEQDRIADDEAKFKDDPLTALAEETGGRFFHNSNDLERGVQELAATPDVSYVLGFTPENLRQDGAYHSLKVNLANSHGLTISAREGYYAPQKPKEMTADQKLVRFEDEVLAGDTVAGIPASLEVKPRKLDNGDSELNLKVHLEIAKLPFKKENDRSTERLIMVTALFDDKNDFLTGAEQIVDLSLRAETLATLSKDGFDAKMSLEAPPGNYRVRQVIVEVATGKLAAMNQTVLVQ
ncbi:MAG TPA: VWA domain-containing protein [Candidatus Acidoferrales bacterium]|nr:VWA domain-containing protein [Candidatus Acidoferrales bacterium]